MTKETKEEWYPTKEEFEAITVLTGDLQSAKLVEAAANQARVTIEAKLAALIPGKEEGQKTVNLADKRKVVVERGLIYRADLEGLLGAINWRDIGFAPPVASKTTKSLHVPGYKWYKKFEPEAFAQIAKHVEVKPKKTAVTIKPAPAAKKKAKAKVEK